MSDITMCQQDDCPKSWWCWSYNAPPNKDRQSYFAPVFNDDGCENFWDMKEISREPSDKPDYKLTTQGL